MQLVELLCCRGPQSQYRGQDICKLAGGPFEAIEMFAMSLKRIGVGGLLFGLVETANAGMTVYDLNDVVRLRIEDISFFAVLLLVSGLGIRFLWNHVARGLPILPRLSYSRALCLTGLLSLFMLLVLSMISGARELLTPGVWRRQGSAYYVNDPASEPLRRQSIETLRATLNAYARDHRGRFPPHDFVPEIPERIWQSPDHLGTRYIYVAGQTAGTSNLLACEPGHFGDERFALLANGEIRKMKASDIHRAMGIEDGQ
jgi:hypothetical protein